MNLSFAIKEELDLFEVRRGVKALARALGFSATAAAELAIVVSELGTNILKYAPPGSISLSRIGHPERGEGIKITARDRGAPFEDLAAVLARSRRVGTPMEPEPGHKGLRGGLGAVERLTDQLEVSPVPGGKAISVIRYRARRRLW